MFLSVGPIFEEGGRGSRKFWPEAEILGIFSIEVAPKYAKKIFLKDQLVSWFYIAVPQLSLTLLTVGMD